MNKLTSWMKENGLNQAAAAERFKIDASYLSYIINGERTPSPKIAKRIVKATKGSVQLEDLYA